ncbi:DJ-1/PfpI family protein [Mycobacterium kansasii 662]|uniref:DJ-1/PfpI family protein n=1 Tax=Mycobacterium kansasii 662 TaxID=1299326 RepID=X7XWU6_MYCKA|nr:DJ-1/PfpI family protein [Mycobacterium kansasii]ETZ99090.1 DJ-1/PfpI family protein [Mycobacterium kansasii 662]
MVRKVLIVGFPGIQALDVVGPFEVFAGASLLTRGGYDVTLVSPDGQPVTTATGLALMTQPLPDPSAPVDTVLLPGGRRCRRRARQHRAHGLDQSGRGHRAPPGHVCHGRIPAAQAGLLDGRRATTHWAFADRLAASFPPSRWIATPSSSAAPRRWTAAGVTAGIDLALSLVDDDRGTEIAQTVARWLVLYFARPPAARRSFGSGLAAAAPTAHHPAGSGGHRNATRRLPPHRRPGAPARQ